MAAFSFLHGGKSVHFDAMRAGIRVTQVKVQNEFLIDTGQLEGGLELALRMPQDAATRSE